MITLQIEHQVRDFSMWRSAFDSDPLDRAASGVRSYRISRPLDQEDYVMLDMDFDTQEAAVDFLGRPYSSIRSAVRSRSESLPGI